MTVTHRHFLRRQGNLPGLFFWPYVVFMSQYHHTMLSSCLCFHCCFSTCNVSSMQKSNVSVFSPYCMFLLFNYVFLAYTYTHSDLTAISLLPRPCPQRVWYMKSKLLVHVHVYLWQLWFNYYSNNCLWNRFLLYNHAAFSSSIRPWYN